VAAIVMQQTEPQTVESLQVHALNWKPHSLHLTSGFLWFPLKHLQSSQTAIILRLCSFFVA